MCELAVSNYGYITEGFLERWRENYSDVYGAIDRTQSFSVIFITGDLWEDTKCLHRAGKVCQTNCVLCLTSVTESM